MTTDRCLEGNQFRRRAGIRLIRWLVGINLGLVALQALSAGFLMSGHACALTVHEIGAVALQFGALIHTEGAT
jgi:hypothetical protein